MNENMSGRFDYTARVLDGTELCDLSDDYTLPDYMPAIGRVISCTASVALPSTYLGGGSLEFAGGVRYRLHYESAEDSSLWCAELPSEYDILIPSDRTSDLPADPSEISGITEAVAENITARITAPRRLTVKSRIRLTSDLCRRSEFVTAFRGDVSDMGALRYLEEDATCSMIASGSSTPIVCKDKITLSEAGLYDGDSFRIISSRGSVMVNRLEASDSTLDCRGDISVSLLIVSDGDRPRRINRKLPFSTEIALNSDASGNLGIRAYGVCPSVTATADEDGISLEATALISAEAASTAKMRYLKDIYSKSADSETAMTTLSISSPLACFNGNATVSASTSLSELGLDSSMRPTDCNARVLPNVQCEIGENGKLTVSGRMKISVLADNGTELTPAEFDSDIKYTADLRDVSPSSPKINAIASIADTKCRIDGDKIYTDCELCLAILVENVCEIKTVSEVNLTAPSIEKRSGSYIIVCYPTKGATLWDIAKKYRTDAFELAEKNSIALTTPDSPDSLSKTPFLII